MNNQLELYKKKTFDDIMHIDELGNEYWIARELQIMLNYTEWRKFKGVIEKAKVACNTSGNQVENHFVGSAKMVVKGLKNSDNILDHM